ncbi:MULTISPECIES: Ger(x)C family spore germination protein [unclassified Paenibacillus]|uniref:Ger(x)C family spore germination protein n=1 Tax=unclassified Paenibacillus TaxID=185978 RepID=UPI001AE20ACF|nr:MULTISPECIES: Ger(x)C family spore germination protein [unclassified Paenibacillus]MBP1155812.1 spore germination protein KC [Paenibacillus sp. PvP091]MBP1168802.1 spore germination protein KC [Paenibacillus sp. PvR098]MBP2439830.1 spore germination protein KC [Paenibacillus sp. PvP052]
MILNWWKWLLITGLILLLTGCWNRTELNELSIAVAMGLDISEAGQYLVTVQLVNPKDIASKSGGAGGSPVSTFRSQGRSVFEAIRRMTTKLNRKIYLAHLRMLVIGEDLARKGIADPIDFLSRDHELRTDFYVVIAKQAKAGDILDILTPQERIPANKMYGSLEMSEKAWAATGKMTLDMLISDLQSEGKSPVLTGMFMVGPHSKGQKMDNLQSSTVATLLQYDGIAVFKSDKLIGWLNENDSKGYNFIQGKVKSTVGVQKCLGGEVAVELIRTKTKIKGHLTSDGEPEVSIEVYAEGNVGDVTCDINMLDPSSIQQIEQISAQTIKASIQDAVRNTQRRYKTDIFGFGEALRRAYPKHWKQWKQNWDDTFVNLKVQVTVDVDIRRTGTINQSVKSRVRK